MPPTIIILQLKSTQRSADLEDISKIIGAVRPEYRIRGHEVQQLEEILKKTTLAERARMVSAFCSKNEIEYLTYHARIFESGRNIWDEKYRGEMEESIMQSIEEAEAVCSQSGIRNDAIIVFHLTWYVPIGGDLLPTTITREKRLELQSKAEEAFLSFYEREGIGRKRRRGIVMALENGYQKYYPGFATAGPFHPGDISRLQGHGVGTALDLSHYQLYSNYVKYGSGNLLGDLDREIHGRRPPPSWQECIDILSESLVQLHISDARGFLPEGEGLSLGEGEIPVREVLQRVAVSSSSSLNKKTVRGTIELHNGHLDHSKKQLQAVRWILDNAKDVLL